MDDAQELTRRIDETLAQAAADGLLAGDDGDRAAVATGWVLVVETAASESRWLKRFASSAAFPWQWRGWLAEALR